MNYPNLPGDYPSRRPPRKSNFFFLFVLCFMACFLFLQYKKAIGRSNAYQNQVEVKIPDEISFEDPFEANSPTTPPSSGVAAPAEISWEANGPVGRSTNSDWEMDTDVPTDKATSLVVGSDKGGPADKVESGDWSMEVGESAPTGKPSLNIPESKPVTKKTVEGDWELGEVETGPAID